MDIFHLIFTAFITSLLHFDPSFTLPTPSSSSDRIALTPTQEELLRDVFNINVEQVQVYEEVEVTAETESRPRTNRKNLTPEVLSSSAVPADDALGTTVDDLLASLAGK